MYIPFGKVIFRFPHYPVECIRKSVEQDEFLEEVIQRESFGKAIFFASPVLHEELINYREGKLKGKEKEQVRNSLVRYLARMSSRCTPFGLFASCAVGEISENTQIELADEIYQYVRLDMLYLCVLSQELAKLEEIKKQVRYFVNTTLYQKGKKLRYIEYKFIADKRIYQLVEIITNPYLRQLLNLAKEGATYQQLIHFLAAQDEEIDIETATAYIDSIIENQVLVSEIDPIVTGDDFFNQIISIVSQLELNSASELKDKLIQLQELLLKLNDPECKEDTIDLCNRIEEIIKTLKIPYQKKFLLQVDSFRKMSSCTIGQDIVKDLQQYMTFLNRITFGGEAQTLTEFKKAFNERYEEREIPLLEVLDPDSGIGYPANQMNDISPLIQGLALPTQTRLGNVQTITSPIHNILQKKLWTFNPSIDKEILLEDKDITGFPEKWDDLPATMFANFHILNSSSEEYPYYLLARGVSGTSAANLLGRFAYCNEEVHRLINDITAFEKEYYKDLIVAEISHIPDSRVGNILARPSLREYEILYLANSTRNRKELIYPSDILVSVKHNQIMLRSKSLNRFILPRLTTAHNYKNNPTPIYRFLCDLQAQGIRPGLYFDWGIFQQQLEHLPRVRYKNIILSVAKWRIEVKSMDAILNQKDPAVVKEKVKEWKEKNRLPRYVTLADGDNTLFVDLENSISVQAFLSLLKKRTQITLEEFIEEDNEFIKDRQGCSYTNECLMPFYNHKK